MSTSGRLAAGVQMLLGSVLHILEGSFDVALIEASGTAAAPRGGTQAVGFRADQGVRDSHCGM